MTVATASFAAQDRSRIGWLSRPRADRRDGTPFWPALLLVSLLVPSEFSFHVGTLLMECYRLVLIAAIPMIIGRISSGEIKTRPYEVSVLLYGFWAVFSMWRNFDIFQGLQSGGVFALETLVPYYIFKISFKNLKQVQACANFMVVLVLISIPFALIDTVTGTRILHETLTSITHVSFPLQYDRRMGLLRAQGLFDHPILYGAFCAAPFTLVWYLNRGRARIIRVGILALGTFLALSSAPAMILVIGVGCLIWDRVLKGLTGRWTILLSLGALACLTVQIFSSHSFIITLSEYLTFDPATAWARVLQWQFGGQSIWEHPIFGIGTDDFVRPIWMLRTIDSTILFIMVKYGIPELIFMLIFVFTLMHKMSKVSFREGSDGDTARKAWIISMASLLICGITVDYWNQIYVYFNLFIGLGTAIFEILAAFSYSGGEYSSRLTTRSHAPVP